MDGVLDRCMQLRLHLSDLDLQRLRAGKPIRSVVDCAAPDIEILVQPVAEHEVRQKTQEAYDKRFGRLPYEIYVTPHTVAILEAKKLVQGELYFSNVFFRQIMISHEDVI